MKPSIKIVREYLSKIENFYSTKINKRKYKNNRFRVIALNMEKKHRIDNDKKNIDYILMRDMILHGQSLCKAIEKDGKVYREYVHPLDWRK